MPPCWIWPKWGLPVVPPAALFGEDAGRCPVILFKPENCQCETYGFKPISFSLKPAAKMCFPDNQKFSRSLEFASRYKPNCRWGVSFQSHLWKWQTMEEQLRQQRWSRTPPEQLFPDSQRSIVVNNTKIAWKKN
jgi:hypothetical protein